jgi:uncharacterized membrane protein
MSIRAPAAVLCLAATAGLVFASVSTLDFVAHLDRQVHDLHCSFVPGVVASTEGAEGCKATLMSPYSSLFRRSMWGGIPISLPAMAVFAFLLFRGVDLMGRPPGQQRSAANVVLVASLIPVIASITMGWIAFTELHAACKLCIGIYISSAFVLIGAIWARMAAASDDAAANEGAGMTWLVAAAQLGGFVVLPTAAYAMMTPDFSSYIGSCGKLESVDDPYGVLVPIDDHAGGTPTVEVLDPLCPACRAFEERLGASGLSPSLHRVALLFPLDQTCNWMVSKSLHPGACAVSEAVLCAQRQGMSPNAVIEWAFENQEDIIAAEKANPGSAAERVARKFEALGPCLGSAEVQSDLNKSLRWAVAHELPVMTPQLYVGGVKLCDEDTDLGMEWALSRVLERQKDGSLPVIVPGKPAPKLAPVAANAPRAEPVESETPSPKKAAEPRTAAARPSASPATPAEPEAAEPKAAEPKAAEPKAAEPKAAEPEPEPEKPEPEKPEAEEAEPAKADKPKPKSKLPSVEEEPEEEDEP